MQGLNIVSNYVPNIQHLPGIIDGDVLGYLKIPWIVLERIKDNTNNAERSRFNNARRMTHISLWYCIKTFLAYCNVKNGS